MASSCNANNAGSLFRVLSQLHKHPNQLFQWLGLGCNATAARLPGVSACFQSLVFQLSHQFFKPHNNVILWNDFLLKLTRVQFCCYKQDLWLKQTVVRKQFAVKRNSEKPRELCVLDIEGNEHSVGIHQKESVSPWHTVTKFLCKIFSLV